MIPSYTFKPIAERDCPPERVRELAAEGKTQMQIAKMLGMAESTFRAKVGDAATVGEAWRAGREAFLAARAATRKTTGAPISRETEDFYVVPLKEGDFAVYLAVACGMRRRAQIARACELPTGVVVGALERLEEHALVRVAETIFFNEYEAFYADKGRLRRAASPLVLLLVRAALRGARAAER